jgi:hypothetical protein
MAAGLTLSMGYVFGVFTLGGCAGSQGRFAPPADGQLPERVVEKLAACSKRGPAPLQPQKHTISFDVFVDSDGHVEQVALRDSTLHLDEVEACMEDGLHALSERPADASLRRRQPGPLAPLSPEARALFAQPVAIPAGAAQAFLVAGLLAIAVVVYFQVVHNTKTHKPPPANPDTAQPPQPDKDPVPEPEGEPKADGPKPPLPPPPPPPPPPKETCEEKMPDRIRCDDPKISGYGFRSEDGAFKEIIRKLGQGVRKSKAGDLAQRGPCVNRGGFHTNVLRGGASVASIVGCNCCDDTNGKAIEKQRAAVVYK